MRTLEKTLETLNSYIYKLLVMIKFEGERFFNDFGNKIATTKVKQK